MMLNAKLTSAAVLISACCVLAGCSTTSPGYSYGGGNAQHLVHHQSPGTADALQAVGEAGYQLRGRSHGVTAEKYNNSMRGLGAIGTLLDFMNRND